MPELTEIETIRRRIEKTLKNHRIETVKLDLDDYVCFDEAEPSEVAKALKGAVIEGVGRKGKYFWLELNRRPWPLIHLGMSGDIELRRKTKSGKPQFQYGWGPAPAEGKCQFGTPPRFCRLFLHLEKGVEFALTDPRRFGRVRLMQSPEESVSLNRLGYDPLIDFPSNRVLYDKLHRRRIAIKAALLDQNLFAGVGNWIADEVLYQSAIAPYRLASELRPDEVTTLRRKLLSIIKKSVELEGDNERYPKDWLFNRRWGKKKNATDHAGRKIVHHTIGGRTTAWVPELQS